MDEHLGYSKLASLPLNLKWLKSAKRYEEQFLYLLKYLKKEESKNMNNDLKRIIYYAELVYKKIVETLFELNDAQRLISKKSTLNDISILGDKLFDKIKVQLHTLQNMLNTLKDKLAGVGIYADVLEFPDNFFDSENYILKGSSEYNKNIDNLSLIKDKLEELKIHVENAAYLLKIMQNENVIINSEKQKKINEIKKAIVLGKELLLKVKVVESKLDAITDCRSLAGTLHLHGIETYQQIQELFTISEELSFKLTQFGMILEKLDINESLEFSMDGPLENTKNYILMLLMHELSIRSLLLEKYEQIQVVRQKIEKIIGILNKYI